MSNRIKRARQHAFERQQGYCDYCGCLMWLRSAKEITSPCSLTTKQANKLKCTAEHVRARCDGGGNEETNIIAACAYCNRRRHARKYPLSSEQFRFHVRSRQVSALAQLLHFEASTAALVPAMSVRACGHR